MNYFELHLGDYEAATAHLTALEDGIYCRLLRIYYRTEKPLPADLKQICRLARAQAKPEREAVEQVLADFFELREDGWHQARCDAEIERFKAGEPEREVKKANEDNRLKRHREERARLFKVLTDAGQHAPWNIGMNELRELVKRCGPPLPETAPATPATATQTPDTNHQTPVVDTEDLERATRAPAPEPDTSGHQPTAQGLIGRAMKQAGLAGINTADPRLLELIRQGATVEEFAGIAAEAMAKSPPKGFAWVLATLQARRTEAAAITLAKREPAAQPWAGAM